MYDKLRVCLDRLELLTPGIVPMSECGIRVVLEIVGPNRTIEIGMIVGTNITRMRE